VGPLFAQFSTARFARTLGSMLKAGVPLLQGLESARTAVTNHYLNAELAGVIEAVRGGAHLSTALGAVAYVPPVAPQMIAIGEETGQLDNMLLRVATMFERQTQRSIERAMGLLTPVLTIVIAAVVGGLIMTVMDAVLGINELAVK
jgi:general secretion pathway protein F